MESILTRTVRELNGLAAPGGRRALAALLCVTGLAIFGYAGEGWIRGDQPLPFPARAMGTSVAVPADHLDTGLLLAGSQIQPAIFSNTESDRTEGLAHLDVASDFELTGILLIGGRLNMAIIADAGGQEKVFRVGDQIRADVTLAEVSPNGVTIVHGDYSHHLPLAGKARGKYPPPGNGQAISLREELVAAKMPSVSDATAVPRQRVNVSPEVHTQGVIISNPGGGFQLKKVRPTSLYARMGLRTGDVLLGMNGRPIDSPDQLMLLYQQLDEGGRGNVELLREGRLESLQFNGR